MSSYINLKIGDMVYGASPYIKLTEQVSSEEDGASSAKAVWNPVTPYIRVNGEWVKLGGKSINNRLPLAPAQRLPSRDMSSVDVSTMRNIFYAACDMTSSNNNILLRWKDLYINNGMYNPSYAGTIERKSLSYKVKGTTRYTQVSVYTPYGYTTSKKYNVIVALHGAGGDDNECFKSMSHNNETYNGKSLYDWLFGIGYAEPCIIVGIKSNSAGWGERLLREDFSTMILECVIPYITSNYSVTGFRNGWGFVGFSDGAKIMRYCGFQDLTCVFSHFGYVAGGYSDIVVDTSNPIYTAYFITATNDQNRNGVMNMYNSFYYGNIVDRNDLLYTDIQGIGHRDLLLCLGVILGLGEFFGNRLV